MADKSAEKTLKAGAESPTTARPLDFDDDVQDSSATPDSALAPPPPAKSPKPRVSFQEEEAPPAKPPRPVNPLVQAENTLIEAFPSVDAKVVKAVLVASGGKVEPAFNALLSMSDPDFVAEETPPAQPPRPRQPQNQLEADEQYARQLAQHYQGASAGYGSRERGEPPLPQRRKDSSLKPNELYDDRDHSFFDDIADDLPKIKEDVKKGFLETQNTVNRWITNFRKKLDGDDEESDVVQPGGSQNQRHNFGPSTHEQLYGIRKSSEARRSGDRERYDADNRVLGDDFEALELRDEEGPTPHSRLQRPLANPDLFKPTPVAPPQGGPVDEVEARDRFTQGNKTKKWQPLTSVAPHPEPEDEHDPFSLGDSDEDETKTKDTKAEDTERLKKLASESGAEQKGDSGKELKPAERSGSLVTRDQAAEELFKSAK